MCVLFALPLYELVWTWQGEEVGTLCVFEWVSVDQYTQHVEHSHQTHPIMIIIYESTTNTHTPLFNYNERKRMANMVTYPPSPIEHTHPLTWKLDNYDLHIQPTNIVIWKDNNHILW